jgi:hypothetical protein
VAALADDFGLEVGELLRKMIVKGLRLAQLVEGIERLSLRLEILGRLDEKETAIPDLGGVEPFLGLERSARGGTTEESRTRNETREQARARSLRKAVRVSHVTVLYRVGFAGGPAGNDAMNSVIRQGEKQGFRREENDTRFSLRSVPIRLSVGSREGGFIRKAKGMHSFFQLNFHHRKSEKKRPPHGHWGGVLKIANSQAFSAPPKEKRPVDALPRVGQVTRPLLQRSGLLSDLLRSSFTRVQTLILHRFSPSPLLLSTSV